MTDDVNEFMMGGGGAPSCSFLTIGTVHRGVIVDTAVSQQTTPDGDPKFWPNGDPMRQAVLTIQTDERDPEVKDDDGLRRLFVKGQMQAAVRDAIKASGADGLEVGGMIGVRYDSDGERSSPGKNPPKQYVAQYAPPAPAVNDLLGVGTGAAAPTNGPVTVPAAPPAPVQPQPASDLF